MTTTRHERPDGLRLVLEGERVYDVTIRTDDGRSVTERVAADTKQSAKTRAFAVTDLRLGAATVEYDVSEVLPEGTERTP